MSKSPISPKGCGTVVNVCKIVLGCMSVPKPLCRSQGEAGSLEVYWVVMEKLIINHKASAACQVSFHGHQVGVLIHYNPFPDTPDQPSSAFTSVDLQTCCLESAVVVLLSWAASFALALQNGLISGGHTINFTLGRIPVA